MFDPLNRMWKEAAVVRFEILCRHLPRTTEEFHESPYTVLAACSLRFQPGTSWIRSTVATLYSDVRWDPWDLLSCRTKQEMQF